MSVNYKDTLHLPATTTFQMRPNVAALEETIRAKWESIDVYATLRRELAGVDQVVVHDGPPYANGEIHMGHLINKVLKDIIVRYLTMKGHDSPFVPGWDCHGLPIERKVAGDEDVSKIPLGEFRDRCLQEAMHWVDTQRSQFRQLGILADWDNPYLTTSKQYEDDVLSVLEKLQERGKLVRKLKPIHWCAFDRTALAEAELEYADVESNCLYVRFPIHQNFPGTDQEFSLVAWTTTPWTLPGNVALAVAKKMEYMCVRCQDGTVIAVASTRVESTLNQRNPGAAEVYGTCLGEDLVGMTYDSIIKKDGVVRQVVAAPFVLDTVGTGVVHIAPAHGVEDFILANSERLPVLRTVDEAGIYVPGTHPQLDGKSVAHPNIAKLISSNQVAQPFIFAQGKVRHLYPHCWRCKKPTITRATSQWFIDLDAGKDDNPPIRNSALQDIDKRIEWIPPTTQNRIRDMVAVRPDWCISRQRRWGVAIPAIECVSCGTQQISASTIALCKHKGSTWWLDRSSEYPKDTATCPSCGGREFVKGSDILDVWFESGSSFVNVLSGECHKTIYVEGSDQHRGWFQSSLLLGQVYWGGSPFSTAITHGWVVGPDGKKFSKSDAAPPVKGTVAKFGADVVRWFAASQDYRDDYRIDDVALKACAESYAKVRNTFRFIIGNVQKFPDGADLISLTNPIDFYILGKLNELVKFVEEAYASYLFYKVQHAVYNFCVVDLSSIYFETLKDRLYADRLDSVSGKAARYVLGVLYTTMAKLVAPILPYLAEELWGYVNEEISVVQEEFPTPLEMTWCEDREWDLRWETLFDLRSEIFAEIEKARVLKEVGKNEEISVSIRSQDMRKHAVFVAHGADLVQLCRVSEIVWDPMLKLPEEGSAVVVKRSPHPKCKRCWRCTPDVAEGLCVRCVDALK